MINLPKHIICTRKINFENKSLALNNNIIIDDYEFLTIQHLCSNELLKTLSNSIIKTIFTSLHAVESVYRCLQNNNIPSKNVQCYAIEGRTANLAIEYGFTVFNTGVDGQSLAKLIIDNNETSVVHFTTLDSRKEIEEALTNHSIEYHKILVYEKTVNSIKISKPFDGITFFSPSQVDGFLKSNKLEADIPAFCIGETTKAHLKNYHHQNIHVAESTNEIALIQKVINYFNNKTLQ
jgi:uroporphyrinogen-III synthase